MNLSMITVDIDELIPAKDIWFLKRKSLLLEKWQHLQQMVQVQLNSFPQFQVFLLGGPKFLVGQEPTFLYFSGVNHLHQAPLPHQIICLE